MVGKRHQRKNGAPQGASWNLGAVPEQVCGHGGCGRSPVNHQQPLETQKPSPHNRQYAVGALCLRGTASKSNLYARHISHRDEKMDPATLGEHASGRCKDGRSGARAAGNRAGRRNQGQSQMCDVGLVFPRRALGVLRPQSNFLGDTGGNGGKAEAEHRCSHQREAPRPQSSISQSDFRQVIRSSSPRRLVGPYKLGLNPTDLPCSHEFLRLHAGGTNPGSISGYLPCRIQSFCLPL